MAFCAQKVSISEFMAVLQVEKRMKIRSTETKTSIEFIHAAE